jgi:hypothetical protein
MRLPCLTTNMFLPIPQATIMVQTHLAWRCIGILIRFSRSTSNITKDFGIRIRVIPTDLPR